MSNVKNEDTLPRKAKEHIVFMINDITQLGGTERMCTLICNELSLLGYSVTISSVHESGDAPFFPLDKQVQRTVVFKEHLPRDSKLKLPFAMLKKVRSLNADYYLSCDTQMCLFAFLPLLGKTHLAWEHFNSQIVTRFGSRWFGRRLASLFCKKIIVLTESDKNSWIKSIGTNESKLSVIPNPLPVNRLSQYITCEREKTVLAVGRMTEQKGFDLLIQAWAQIATETRESWKLRIVGPNGSAKPQLEKMIQELKLTGNVELASASNNIVQEYRKASLYVLSSRYEGFGLTLIEAMGQGMPVVAFDCPMGPGEIVSDKYGKLLPFGDLEALSKSIEQFLLDKDLREKYGRLAHERSSDYAPEKIIRQWASTLDSIQG